MEDHTYYVAEEKAMERELSSLAKKRKYGEAKRNRDKRRQKTRINIGVAFNKWKSLMSDRCFQSDKEFACFLLDMYEKVLEATAGQPFEVNPPPTSNVDDSNGMDSRHDTSFAEEDMEENRLNDPLNSVSDWTNEGSPLVHEKEDDGETDDSSDEDDLPPNCIRLGGTLKKGPTRYRIIRIGGTTPERPVQQKPPDAPSSCCPTTVFPEKKHVLSEDDIIGARASIVYENCLRQLVTFLILPVDKCTGLLKTGVMCNHVAPFEINITSKGTATNVEWICPNGHSLWSWNSQSVMKFGMQAGDFLLSTNILLSGNTYAKVALLFKYMNMGMVSKNNFYSIQDMYGINQVKNLCEEKKTETLVQEKNVEVPEIPQQPACKEEVEQEEVCNQVSNSTLHQEEAQIKEEQEDLCVTLQG